MKGCINNKKILSAFLATSMVMAACVAASSVASAVGSDSVQVPTNNGEFVVIEGENYSLADTYKYSESVQTNTYDVNGTTPHSQPKYSGSGVLLGTTKTTNEITFPVKIEIPIEVAQTTVYTFETVAAGGNTVYNTNQFTLDGVELFTTNTTPTVEQERLGWKTKTGNFSENHEAVKYTTTVTINEGEHTLALVINKRSGNTNYGQYMLDYIKLTSCGAPGTDNPGTDNPGTDNPETGGDPATVNLPTANGSYYTWEAEDYLDEFPANNAVVVASSTYDVGSNTAHSESLASGGDVLQSGGVTDVPVSLTLPIYASTEIQYELEVVAAGGNTVFNTDYFTLDGDTIFTTNASPTNGLGGTVTATRLGWKTKSGNNSDYYEAVKYTTRITIPAGNHNLAFVVPKRETANWGSFMLDYIKLTSCAPETIIDCKIDVEGENYVGKYYIENNSEVEPSINMLLMLATYDENNVMTAITPVPITADGTAKTGSITLAKTGTSKARMFLWSGTDYIDSGNTSYKGSVVKNNE